MAAATGRTIGRRTRKKVGIVILVAVAGVVGVTAPAIGGGDPAEAHNYLVSSTPASGEVLTSLPARFEVTTNGVLLNINKNGSGFALQVRDAAGRYYGDGCVIVDGPTISTPAAIGAAGDYTVTWQVISTDGHTVSDTFPFSWKPEAAAASRQTAGSDSAPSCHGTYHLDSSGLPPASSGTGSAAVGGDTLVTVLWVGGAVLAVGVTLLLTGRRRKS